MNIHLCDKGYYTAECSSKDSNVRLHVCGRITGIVRLANLEGPSFLQS